MYPVNCLLDLLNKCNRNWLEMVEYLESTDGGKFCISDENDRYAIIRYDKGSSVMTHPYSRWLRSVIWDKTTCTPICVAPPKASSSNTFTDRELSSVYCEEYLDGVMINIYRVSNDPTIQIASRSSLGATGTYYSHRPFSALLDDALAYTGQTLEQYLPVSTTTTSVFASILLQHPEHRVVETVSAPNIYLIHQGFTKLETGAVTLIENSTVSRIWNTVPEGLTINTLPRWIGEQAEIRGWSWQGVVFKDGNGNRWRLRAAPYRLVRSLRGTTSKPEIRFAWLRQQNLLDTYLYYYPEERNTCEEFEKSIKNIAQNIYDTYVTVHITKQRSIESVDTVLKSVLFSIHGMYINILRPIGRFVRKSDVEAMINIMSWQQLAMLIS
jgi:hypothetical protein